MTGKFTELSCVVLSGFEHFYLFKLHWHKKVKKVEYELSKQIKRNNNISDGVKLQTTAGDFDGFSEVVLYLPYHLWSQGLAFHAARFTRWIENI